MSATESTILGIFADHTTSSSVMTVDITEDKTTGNLHLALNNIKQCSKYCKIKLDRTKSIHVVYTIRHTKYWPSCFLMWWSYSTSRVRKFSWAISSRWLDCKHFVRQKLYEYEAKLEISQAIKQTNNSEKSKSVSPNDIQRLSIYNPQKNPRRPIYWGDVRGTTRLCY